MQVEFDSLKHEYKINGVIVPGVTSILGQNPEVYKYAARKKGLPDNYYVDRGSAIHLMIYMYEMNKNPKEFAFWATYSNYREAWIKFKSENIIEVLEMELVVASENLMLAGTLDVLCMMNGSKWILDLKSGAYSPSHEIQVSGYKKLYEDDTRIIDHYPPKKIGGVYLRKNGTYSFREYKYNPDEVIRLRGDYENRIQYS